MRRWLLAIGTALALPVAAGAQRAVTVRADNDAFNFWQQPWERPDEEYTSGVRLTLDWAGDAAWARWLGRARCADGTRGCASHDYALGQDIYTAPRTHNNPIALPNGRPDAGVLWLAGASRVAREAQLTEVGWRVGVTGDLSLAKPMQRFFHSLGPEFNRPITWGKTLPTEPAFELRWDESRLLAAAPFALTPHAGVSAGTLLTEVRAGLALRAGAGLSHPWLGAPRRRGVSYELTGDLTARGVVRNETLSGTAFRDSPRVPLRAYVTEIQGGVRVRVAALEAAFVAHNTGAEYRSRSTSHSWSTLELRWYPAP